MANQASKATAPTVDGKVYHLRLAKGDAPPYVVLPGDQAATEHISAVWQDTKGDRLQPRIPHRDGRLRGLRHGDDLHRASAASRRKSASTSSRRWACTPASR